LVGSVAGDRHGLNYGDSFLEDWPFSDMWQPSWQRRWRDLCAGAMNLSPPIGINLRTEEAMFGNFPARSATAATPKRSADASDVTLVGRIAAGDSRAFEALYRTYHPRLDRFLGLMTSRRTIVEEALNDTMLVVWKRSDTYNGQSKVSTWIFAIAYRTALKALRTQDEPLDTLADELASDDAGPEQLLSADQTRAALSQALEELSAEQRSVLVLTYFHDLPYAEIARIVGCPVDTVKTRMFHGRRRLRALLCAAKRP
jgi:RNA polymerase sigma factor (sigma-70 family)